LSGIGGSFRFARSFRDSFATGFFDTFPRPLTGAGYPDFHFDMDSGFLLDELSRPYAHRFTSGGSSPLGFSEQLVRDAEGDALHAAYRRHWFDVKQEQTILTFRAFFFQRSLTLVRRML
jgi:hypothetical protein